MGTRSFGRGTNPLCCPFTRTFFIVSFNWSAALDTIQGMIRGFIALLPLLVIGIIVFFLFHLLARWARSLVRRFNEHRGGQTNAGILLGKLTQWVIVIFGLLVALTIVLPGFDPSTLVAALGLSGLAIGFAFKDIAQNFLAGILILVTNPFRVGDQIKVGDFEGTVQEIQTRATLIRTYDGRRVVIPNSDVYTDKVTVNTAFENRRTQYDVGIGYGDDVDHARELMLNAIRGIEGVLEQPAPDVLLVELAGSSVNLRARWWSKPERGDVLRVQDRVLTAIKNTLTDNGIDLPFPTQQILFHDQTEATDGNRKEQREGWPAGKGEVPEPRSIGGPLAELAERNGKATDDGRPAEARAGNAA